MTPTQIMTEDAEAAAIRYDLLVQGWRALYTTALDQSHFGSPKQLHEVRVRAYGMAHAYLATEQGHVERETEAYAREAQRATSVELGSDTASELSGATSEHLRALDDYLMHEIKVQIERDIALLLHSLQSVHLHVRMAARASHQPLRAALMQFRVGNASELQFVFHDRRARRWPSRRFIRSAWRHHLLSAYNETVLITLSEHGVDTAEIRHPDPKSQHHGVLVSLDSNSELPTYAELKPAVFHPNSDAILGRPT